VRRLFTLSTSSGSGTIPNVWDSTLIPRKIVANRAPITTSVIWALRASGGLNAGTPLETASVPVRATEPDAKARKINNRLSELVAWASIHVAGGV
jgi:hypothetical protein